MPNNRINATLSQADIDTALADVASLHQHLPFLIDLTADERQGMVKFGEKNRSFVTKALALASQNPDILPRSFNLDEMRADVNLVENLYPIQLAVTHLLGQIEDTYYAAGSEAYSAALQVYTYAKAANLATGTLEDALDDLGRRFVRRSRAPEKPSTRNATSS